MSFVDTIGRNPSVSKCNWLHVVIFWFFFWKSEEYSIDSSKITSYFLECLNFTTYFSNSCPDHTKLFVRSQPWDCSGLCQEMDVDPPLFTLLQLEMLTDGVGTGWRDQSLNQFICNERLVLPFIGSKCASYPHTGILVMTQYENVWINLVLTTVVHHLWYFVSLTIWSYTMS